MPSNLLYSVEIWQISTAYGTVDPCYWFWTYCLGFCVCSTWFSIGLKSRGWKSEVEISAVKFLVLEATVTPAHSWHNQPITKPKERGCCKAWCRVLLAFLHTEVLRGQENISSFCHGLQLLPPHLHQSLRFLSTPSHSIKGISLLQLC